MPALTCVVTMHPTTCEHSVFTKKAGLRGEYPEDIHAAICGKDILTCQIKMYILVMKGDKSEFYTKAYRENSGS